REGGAVGILGYATRWLWETRRLLRKPRLLWESGLLREAGRRLGEARIRRHPRTARLERVRRVAGREARRGDGGAARLQVAWVNAGRPVVRHGWGLRGAESRRRHSVPGAVHRILHGLLLFTLGLPHRARGSREQQERPDEERHDRQQADDAANDH